jgi:hypothetical protein
MTPPAWLLTIRWLTWDTYRQSRVSGVFWVMLAVSGLCALGCLSISYHDLPLRRVDDVSERLPASEAERYSEKARKNSGVDFIQGEIHFLFGAVRVPWARYREDAVHFLQLILVDVVAGTMGIGLALIWTAGFLPAFLEPSAATVLLAKPVPRWSLLAGKYLGVLVFFAFQATVFVAGTWLALGVRSDIWDMTYLLCLPVLLVHFAVFFTFSVFLAVWTRSTVTCIFGTLVFWVMCFGMNFGHHEALALGQGLNASFGWLLEAGYWFLPKPWDLLLMQREVLHADIQLRQYESLKGLNAFHLELSLLASLAFALVTLGLSSYEFVHTDY